IDGESYHLPSPDQPPIEIILPDGTLAQLASGQVTIRGQTVDLPSDISSPRDISIAGQTITARPGTSKKPEHSGGGDGDSSGLFHALEGIASAAGSAAARMANVRSSAFEWASSGATTLTSGLAESIASAVSEIGGFVDSINGIQESFELEELTEDGRRRVFRAQNLGRESFDWLKSMGNVIKGFNGLKGDAQQHVRDNILKYAAVAGGLAVAEEAMRRYSDFPWIIITSQTITISSAQSESYTSPTTQPQSDSTGPTPYFITTKDGTSSDTFKRFIEDLDGGAGTAYQYDMSNVPHQHYATKLNASFAANLPNKYPFIQRIFPELFDPADLDSPNESGGYHGTMMATIAAGKTLGIAPNAHLHLVKGKNQYSTDGTTWRNYGYQPRAVSVALDEVRRHIMSRLRNDPSAKSILNLSWGVELNTLNGPTINAIFGDFLAWSELARVTVVMAAGNDDGVALHQKTPQNYGTGTNRIVTVGAVKKDGTLREGTAPHQPGQAGSMTVFAPGEEIRVPSLGNRELDDPVANSGTSQAAAIVSGLGAYLMAVPELSFFHHSDIPTPEEDVKQYMVAHAWTRVPPAAYANPPPHWPPITNLDVVYNLARGDPAHPDNP
ncbi:subtilisin-like protein, partial [Polyplosphaeria fusca]